MYPDATKLHTKTVDKIVNTKKTFSTKKRGQVTKYLVYFTDGYEAEVLCPAGEAPKEFTAGATVTFRIGYRNDMGDEIEAVSTDMAADPAGAAAGGGSISRIATMHGHPAAIALRAAVDVKSIGGIPPAMISDVIDAADMFYEWLLRKQSGVED